MHHFGSCRGQGRQWPYHGFDRSAEWGNVGHVPVAVFCGVPSLFGTFGCKNIYIYIYIYIYICVA